MSRDWWKRQLEKLMKPVLKQCHPTKTFKAFQRGQPIGGVHACVCLGWGKSWLEQAPSKRGGGAMGLLKMMPHGKQSSSRKSLNRAYLKVLKGAIDDEGFINRECYLHQLLCFMYHGPCPSTNKGGVAGHRCHHKLCILPWHIEWITQSQNVAEGYEHRRKRVKKDA